ncbi:DUF6232 family protein [Micromonospora echinofusca]|uniref:Uncharacterized protein n=1 Tax=Micromonospora echinofusca TaxID=47858 RepID=A0ABS3VSZ7_MICEH|nr:DUF6232 family protein [Micromonospora echinofusca]MBO4207659.1 hypothetical protein [Micromonospora echinofusca]
MGYALETVQVAVRNRTLWVGDHAYPLHNIARVRSAAYVPDRSGAIRAFVRSAVKTAVGGLFGFVLLACLGDAAPGAFYVILLLVVAGVFALQGLRLARALNETNIYALMVETAGSPHVALMSRDREQVQYLVHQIVEAIDNPAKEFAITVENIHGDKVLGSKFLGDNVTGNKVVH